MINDINDKIKELKEEDDNFLKYIECFCEIEKVIEDNSVEYQELIKIKDSEYEEY